MIVLPFKPHLEESTGGLTNLLDKTVTSWVLLYVFKRSSTIGAFGRQSAISLIISKGTTTTKPNKIGKINGLLV